MGRHTNPRRKPDYLAAGRTPRVPRHVFYNHAAPILHEYESCPFSFVIRRGGGHPLVEPREIVKLGALCWTDGIHAMLMTSTKYRRRPKFYTVPVEQVDGLPFLIDMHRMNEAINETLRTPR